MSESEPKSKRSWTDWVLWFVAIATLLGFIGVCYKAFGPLGNAFIIAIAILAIIYVLAEELIFRGQGLFLKIARKIGSKLKKTKGGPDV